MTVKVIYKHDPDYAVAPGVTLQETIDSLEMDQKDLAIRTGLHTKTINQIIKGIHPLSQQTAIKLERVTGVPARIWNNLEMIYQERHARMRDRENLELQLEWLKTIPVKELIKRGIISDIKDRLDLLRAVLSFFRCSNTEEWNQFWTGSFACQFRRSHAFDTQPEAMATWIRLGEIQAQEIQCQPYSETLFKKALWEIRSLTGTPVDSWQKSIEALCSPSGVAFTLVKEIPKCPVSGLTRWLTPDKALIQMTIRYKTDDHFWFTFFHEAGHILNDSKKTVFLDVNHDDDESEAKANKFAAEWLIPPKYAKALPNLKSHADVINFAKEIGIAPGIVVGQMQKKEIIPWSSFLSKLKRKIKWGDE